MFRSLKYRYGLIIFAYIFDGITAYQFDTDNVIVYRDATAGPGDKSYFGYSVGLWNNNPGSVKPSVIVGAPRGNSSFRDTVPEPGTVFRCGIGEKCEELNLPISGHSWLGASLVVENSEKLQAVVCAPRWGDGTIYDDTESMRGKCFRITADNFSNTSAVPLKPLAGEKAYSNYVEDNGEKYILAHLGASGFSIHVIYDHEDLRYVFGSPGLYHQSGTLSILKNDNTVLVQNDATLFSGANTYSGYAVTSGNYSIGLYSYVVGAPRGGKLNLWGEVRAFRLRNVGGTTKFGRKIEYPINGTQSGEYFGAALASCNIDNDIWDELLVGAPYWSDLNSVEEGRIYIWKGKINIVKGKSAGWVKFDLHKTIEGTTPRGRYGSAITCLGDIDYDGFEDVAVGAPYDDEGKGKVYIYHGSKHGLKHTQTIVAPSDAKGFGISISKPIDIDNNGYADIAVGAYLSGHVTLIRSKCVVDTKVNLTSNLLGELLTIGRNDESFEIKACSYVEARYLPKELKVTRHFKIDKDYRRAYINNEEEYEFDDTVTIIDGTAPCQTYTVHKKANITELFKTLKVSVTQRLIANNEKGTLIIMKNGTKSGEDLYDHSSAVTDVAHQETEQELEIFFALECSNANLCLANLSIHIEVDNLKNTSHYVIGSGPFILKITVDNSGDKAYYTRSIIHMPTFIKLSNGQSNCRSDELGDRNSITCVMANPLDTYATRTITLLLDTLSVPSYTKEIVFEAFARTRSNNSGEPSTAEPVRISCVAETDIGIAGQTDVDLHQYHLPRNVKQQLPSARVLHTYEIKNYNVTPIPEAMLSVSIPLYWVYRGNEIEIVRVYDNVTNLNGEKFECKYREGHGDIVSPTSNAFTSTEWLSGSNMSKFDIVRGTVFGASPDNITLFVNCTSPMIKCKTLDCKIGPLNTTQPMASLVLIFDILLHNFTPDRMSGKNVIFFATNGSTSITTASGINQTINNEPDSILIGTRFIGEPSKYRKRPPTWILPLAIGAGLLLLMFIIIGLCKFGFFDRKSKMKLELLKEREENEITVPELLIQTTSAED